MIAKMLCSHYGPTKAAITNLMQNCAVALGKYGIRANAVLPGTIATDINKEDLKNEAKREYMVNRTLLGRLGSKYSMNFRKISCDSTHNGYN
jgi:L-rhamnose 1-dehydrogenase